MVNLEKPYRSLKIAAFFIQAKNVMGVSEVIATAYYKGGLIEVAFEFINFETSMLKSISLGSVILF